MSDGGSGEGRGGVAKFFGEEWGEDFGEGGGLGNAGGFFGHRGGRAVLGDAGIVRGGEGAGKFVDFDVEGFGVATGGAQQANTPVDPAHVGQNLVWRTFRRGQRCAVQDDSARPACGGSVSKKWDGKTLT